MLRRAAELLGRTDLQADTGRLSVRLFPNLDDAIAAYHEQTLPDHPPVWPQVVVAAIVAAGLLYDAAYLRPRRDTHWILLDPIIAQREGDNG